MPQAKNTKKAKSTSGSGKRPATPAKNPRRREIGAFICLIMGLFTFLAYFTTTGWLIHGLRMFISGLLGWGFFALAPTLIALAIILAFHRGRPVRLRVFAISMVPILVGAVVHLFGARLQTESIHLADLWNAGQAFESGGVISGLLSNGLEAMVSMVGAVIVFIVCFVVIALLALNKTLADIADWFKNREPAAPYEYQEDPAPIPVAHPLPKELTHPNGVSQGASRRRPAAIDIPIDGEAPVQVQLAEKQEKPSRKISFKKPRVLTPDQFLADSEKGGAGTPNAAQAPQPVASKFSKQYDIPLGPDEYIPQVDRSPTVPDLTKYQPKVEEVKENNIEASREAQVVPAPVSAAITAPPTGKVKAAEVQAATAEVAADIEKSLAAPVEKDYIYPSLDFLKPGVPSANDGRQEIKTNVERLDAALASFGIDATIVNVTRGPSVTRYELELEAGVKLNKLMNLADDLALSLGAASVRIAPIPDKISTVGIEVPNKSNSIVALREVLESDNFVKPEEKLTFALGKDISGTCMVGNIAKLPHLLIAGTTGSGKSVTMNSLILSVLYKAKPDEVKFIMIDPKMVEFGAYNGIPHLLIPVVTDPKKAAGALQWGVTEMLKRYKLFSETGSQNLESYNRVAKDSEELQVFPQLVVVIDELADLMLVAKTEVEESICRIAQMGRAAGIHLVVATQRPSADVITGLMKANIPSRIALSVSSGVESRIIMDTMGAERLVGNGDMLYKPIGSNKPTRIQGTYVSEQERERVIAHLKEEAEPQYDDSVGNFIEHASSDEKDKGQSGDAGHHSDYDEMFGDAASVVVDLGQASVSVLQRKLKLGYSRAARLMDQLEEAGIVGPFEGSKPRQVLLTRAQWQTMQAGGEVPPEQDQSFVDIPRDDFADLEEAAEETPASQEEEL